MDTLSKLLAEPGPKHRSPAANGKGWLVGLDRRSAQFRRLRDVMRGLLIDIPQPTERHLQIARRAATLAIICEDLDRQVVQGQAIDTALYSTASNTLRRLLLDLGLDQREDYISQYDHLTLEDVKAEAERRGLPTKIFED